MPGADCFIADHQAAYEGGKVVAVVNEVVAVASVVLSAGAATGVVLAAVAVKTAVNAGVKAVQLAIEAND